MKTGNDWTNQASFISSQNVADFTSEKYWDEFFLTLPNRKQPFEWYADWKDFKNLVFRQLLTNGIEIKHIKDLAVLVIGCGNSTLSEQLVDSGFKKVLSVDYSSVVIADMKQKYRDRAELSFERIDVLDVTAVEERLKHKFDIIVDKGTLDAIYSTDKDATIKEKAKQLLCNVKLMLKSSSPSLDVTPPTVPRNSFYFCVSLLQPFVFSLLFEEFFQPENPCCANERKQGWKRIVQKIPIKGAGKADKVASLIPFLVSMLHPTCQVHEARPDQTCKVIDSWLIEDREYVRREDVGKAEFGNQLQLLLNTMRLPTLGASQLSSKTIGLLLETGIAFQGTVKYSVMMVSSKLAEEKVVVPLGVFVVPQGRENEYLFSEEEGMLELAGSNGIKYLFVIHLNRSSTFQGFSLEKVHEEITPHISELLQHRSSAVGQASLLRDIDFSKIPIFGIGVEEADKMGERRLVCHSKSRLSGAYCVEDVKIQGHWYRRLIFLGGSPGESAEEPPRSVREDPIIQSEARLVEVDHGVTVDHSYLCFELHQAMISSLLLLHNFLFDPCASDPPRFLVVGLGGGSLISFLHGRPAWFPHLDLVGVEIDDAIATLAQESFEMSCDSRVKVVVEDGVSFLRQHSKNSPAFHVVILDVDNKPTQARDPQGQVLNDTAQQALFAPPEVFLETSLLKKIRDEILDQSCRSAVLVLNLACKDRAVVKRHIGQLKELFPVVYSVKVEQSCNFIVTCLLWRKEARFNLDEQRAVALEVLQACPHDKSVGLSCSICCGSDYAAYVEAMRLES